MDEFLYLEACLRQRVQAIPSESRRARLAALLGYYIGWLRRQLIHHSQEQGLGYPFPAEGPARQDWREEVAWLAAVYVRAVASAHELILAFDRLVERLEGMATSPMTPPQNVPQLPLYNDVR